MLDHEIDADVPEAPSLDILVCGALTLDTVGVASTLSDNGAVTMLTQLHTGLGGRGANFAAFAQMLGDKASLLAPVGLDQQRYLASLPYSAALFASPTTVTPSAYLFTSPGAERVYFHSALSLQDYNAFVAWMMVQLRIPHRRFTAARTTASSTPLRLRPRKPLSRYTHRPRACITKK